MAEGFAPIGGPRATVLVLGSLPGRRSLQAGEYYAHPRNAFWRIMGDLFDAGPDLPYAQRAARLAARGVMVWDVLAASVRPGSLDADIDVASAVANDFAGLFARQPGIRLVAFNGRAASDLYARLVAPTMEKRSNTPAFRTLPSTSPAHAAMGYEQKLARWRIISTPARD